MKLYRESPAFRAFVRTVAAAVIAYLVAARAKGNEFGDLHALLYGLYGAVLYAVAGYFTGLEPFVGVKPKNVQVPVPPATPDVT